MEETPFWSGAFKKPNGTYVHGAKNADGSYTFTWANAQRTAGRVETLEGVAADQLLATLRSGGGRA